MTLQIAVLKHFQLKAGGYCQCLKVIRVILYEFLNGLRYTYYCNENNDVIYLLEFIDTSDALPTINPTVEDSTLSIDLHFGNIATYTFGFRCDGYG